MQANWANASTPKQEVVWEAVSEKTALRGSVQNLRQGIGKDFKCRYRQKELFKSEG